MGVGCNTAVAGGSQLLQFGDEGAVLIEQLFRVIAVQPLLDLFQVLFLMRGAEGDIDRNLMGAEGALDGLAVDHLRTGPAFGSAQDDHGPLDMLQLLAGTSTLLDVMNLVDNGIQRVSHLFVHGHGIVALNEVGHPGAALEETLNLLMGHAAKNGRIADFIAVQVQDGQHSTVAHRVQKFVGLPAGSQRAGLSFAIAHGAGHDKVGVIEGGTKGMSDGVTQLAALIDGTRSLRGNVRGNAAGEGELLEQFLHALFIAADVGVDLRIGAVQIGVGHKEVAAVTRTGDQDHILIVLLDDAIQVDIDEVLSGNGSPVADDLLFHIVTGQRTAKQRIVQQVELAGCQIVRRTPIGVDFFQFSLGHLVSPLSCQIPWYNLP